MNIEVQELLVADFMNEIYKKYPLPHQQFFRLQRSRECFDEHFP